MRSWRGVISGRPTRELVGLSGFVAAAGDDSPGPLKRLFAASEPRGAVRADRRYVLGLIPALRPGWRERERML